MNAHHRESLQTRDVAFRERRRVLNGGSGPHTPHSLHAIFKNGAWREVRLDINAAAQPDVVASITDMRAFFGPASFDAVWSSHSLEHLHGHEVPVALAEFQRILKADGFALLRCPDLEAVIAMLLDHGTEHVAYTSPIGPITPLDMLFGHGASIAAGNRHMAHKTGFTAARLGHLLLEAGFGTVFTRSVQFDLWALALMREADQSAVDSHFRAAGLAGFDAVH